MHISAATTTTKSALEAWLEDISPYPQSMAWCHTTDAFVLRALIKAGRFSPRHCEVFNENLTYLFYGRPAFRRRENSQISQGAKAPVVIVFNPDLVGAGRRIFPFDSGAFADKYKDWVHPSMELKDFELSCRSETPGRHVAAFFENNENYLKLIPTSPPKSYVGEFEVESLVSLLKDPSAAAADDRRLALELQIGSDIQLDSSSVVALIFPDELRAAPWLQSFLSGPGAGIETVGYQLSPLRVGGHYQSLLEERVGKIQSDKGLL